MQLRSKDPETRLRTKTIIPAADMLRAKRRHGVYSTMNLVEPPLADFTPITDEPEGSAA